MRVAAAELGEWVLMIRGHFTTVIAGGPHPLPFSRGAFVDD